MKKIFIHILLFFIFIWFVGQSNFVSADWWQRPEVRPTQPSLPRDGSLPTSPPQQPTSTPIVGPSATPGVGGPTQPPSGSGGGGEEDPCASGKSYTGPYCGWSPEKDKKSESDGGNVQRVGGPQVLGLSATSSGDLTASDIMLLTGVLCLLLYVRSKLLLEKSL